VKCLVIPAQAGIQLENANSALLWEKWAAGTAYRMDEVPIPLKAILPSKLPTDDRVLNAIASQLTTRTTVARCQM